MGSFGKRSQTAFTHPTDAQRFTIFNLGSFGKNVFFNHGWTPINTDFLRQGAEVDGVDKDAETKAPRTNSQAPEKLQISMGKAVAVD
jgi:hypothetical protein